VSLSSLKITSRTLFKVKIQNKIWCAQFWKIKGMTWQKDAFSHNTWRCRVSQTQWRWMAKCSRHAAQRRRTRGHQSSYDTKMVWQRADVDEDRSLFLVSTSATRRSSLARYGGAVPCRHRKTRTESLNSIRSGTHSQWRSQSSGVMCSYFHAEQTSRAAALLLLFAFSRPTDTITTKCV